MKCTTDTRERINVAILVIIEMCRVSMGCFTSVFVAHSCTDENTNNECSTMDSWTPSSTFGQIVLGTNAITCIFFLGLYVLEVYRENWLIEYLESDGKIPNTNLSTHISSSLKTELACINRRYWHLTLGTLVLFLCNVFLSARYLDLDKNLHSLSKISAFAGFTILLGQKIYYAATIAYRGRTGLLAQSAFLTIPYTFNTIDADHSSNIIPRCSRRQISPV